MIELVLDGQTNRQIAEFLGIAEKTVERHRSSSMQKLRCRHLVDLVRSMSSMPLESNSARKPVNGSGGDGSCGNEAGDS